MLLSGSFASCPGHDIQKHSLGNPPFQSELFLSVINMINQGMVNHLPIAKI